MKYFITGKKGQLAQSFIKVLTQKGEDFLACDHESLDISQEKAVKEVLSAYKPEVILNCAAYNFVDRAEIEKEKAFQVNQKGPMYLASYAKKYQIKLVHFSTDYVFDGEKEMPYTEDDIPTALSVYGESKLRGERAVLEQCPEGVVFRVSWVFGRGKQNFISKFLSWVKQKKVIPVAYNEISIPTYTDTIVQTVLAALDLGVHGLFHLTSTGYASRYEWAKFIHRVLKIRDVFIRPVNKESFQLAAKRPEFSVLNHYKLSNILKINLPTWEEDVKKFLEEQFL